MLFVANRYALYGGPIHYIIKHTVFAYAQFPR
jgi:hypothetical protein